MTDVTGNEEEQLQHIPHPFSERKKCRLFSLQRFYSHHVVVVQGADSSVIKQCVWPTKKMLRNVTSESIVGFHEFDLLFFFFTYVSFLCSCDT